jgi:hypothetical protein
LYFGTIPCLVVLRNVGKELCKTKNTQRLEGLTLESKTTQDTNNPFRFELKGTMTMAWLLAVCAFVVVSLVSASAVVTSRLQVHVSYRLLAHAKPSKRSREATLRNPSVQ